MAEMEDAHRSPLWRGLWIVLLVTLILFLGGIIAGFTIGHVERGGGGISLFAGAVLAVVVLALAGCLWLIARAWRNWPRTDPLTRKERMNLYILIGSAAVGGITALLLAASGRTLANSNVFTDEPLPRSLALGIVLMLGLVMPAVSIFWHRRVVDEQEADAYKTGALYGLYVYMVGAPVWWFAWRGGFAPEPDGVLIYTATIATVGVVWIWKKYR